MDLRAAGKHALGKVSKGRAVRHQGGARHAVAAGHDGGTVIAEGPTDDKVVTDLHR